MKIHAMTQDTGGCRFYRLSTPFAQLKKLGHETSIDVSITGEQLNELDVLVVQFFNGEQDMEFLRFVSRLKKRPLLVYEVDDDLFSIHEVITKEVAGSNPLIWGREDTQERVKEALGLVDLVTVTNYHLAAMYAPYAQRVAILPNAIPDWLLDLPVGAQPDHFTVGWVCSHSHLLDARDHYDVLQRWMHKNPDARFHWVGPPKVTAFAPWQQKVTPWQKDPAAYLASLRHMGFSVGIAPLADLPFNYGKSGIKAEEYSAIGVPTIASDFPQYQEVIEDGKTGFLVKTKGGWGDKLSLLMNDPARRKEMGAAAKEHVSTRTISKTVYRWIDAYEEALDGRDTA